MVRGTATGDVFRRPVSHALAGFGISTDIADALSRDANPSDLGFFLPSQAVGWCPRPLTISGPLCFWYRCLIVLRDGSTGGSSIRLCYLVRLPTNRSRFRLLFFFAHRVRITDSGLSRNGQNTARLSEASEVAGLSNLGETD